MCFKMLRHYKTDLETYIYFLTGMVLDILQHTYYEHYVIGDYIYIYKYIANVAEWSRALDIRLSDWCCSVSMV